MEEFDIMLQKGAAYSLVEADQNFSAARELTFQKRVSPLRDMASKGVLAFMTALYTINALTNWKTGIISKCYELTLCCIGLYFISKRFALFQKAPPKRGRPIPAKPGPKSKNHSYMANSEIILIIAMQEYAWIGEPLSVVSFCFNFIPALVSHLVYMDKLNPAKDTVKIRALIRIFGVCMLYKFITWKSLLLDIVCTAGTYLLLVNGLQQLNKLVRSLFSIWDIKGKYFNQFYNTLDSIPYPIILFDEVQKVQDSTAPRNLQIVYFNIEGGDFIKRKEDQAKDLGNDGKPTNFLDLIDAQDESQIVEAMDVLKQGKFSKQTFTTELPKHIIGSSTTQKYDVTIWKTFWQEKPVYAAMFSSDNYATNRGAVRFSSKYLEGLVSLLSKTTDTLETLIVNILRFNSSQLDAKSLSTLFCKEVTDLMCYKLLVDNCTIFEPYVSADAWKTFNSKALIINIVDIMSKDLNAKGIDLTLIFTAEFPTSVKARMIFMRSFFFNLFKYFERRIARGKILLACDQEKSEDIKSSEEDQNTVYLKFTLEVQSTIESDLPNPDFLNQNFNQDVLVDSKTFENPTEQHLLSWLNKLRNALNMEVVVDTQSVPFGQKKDKP